MNDRASAIPWLVFALTLAFAHAEEPIRFSEIAKIHQEVVVPVPAEIFNVLDKFGVKKSDWAQELNLPAVLDCQGRAHTALFLGCVVAEGFVAVEAEDASAIRDLGKAVLKLAEDLGLRDAVLKHSKSIIDAANEGNWSKVRTEFDATRKTVNEEMDKRRDQDLAHCVSMGGWVRGTQVVTAIIKQNFAAEKSEVLHQPDLLAHFTKVLTKMKPEARTDSLAKSLGDLQPFLGKEEALTLKEVEQIHDICKMLVKTAIAP